MQLNLVDILKSSKCTRTLILDNYTLVAYFRQISSKFYNSLLRSFLRFFAKKSIFCSKQSIPKKHCINIHFTSGQIRGFGILTARRRKVHYAPSGWRRLSAPLPCSSFSEPKLAKLRARLLLRPALANTLFRDTGARRRKVHSASSGWRRLSAPLPCSSFSETKLAALRACLLLRTSFANTLFRDTGLLRALRCF
jgi:hypothetical protein